MPQGLKSAKKSRLGNAFAVLNVVDRRVRGALGLMIEGLAELRRWRMVRKLGSLLETTAKGGIEL